MNLHAAIGCVALLAVSAAAQSPGELLLDAATRGALKDVQSALMKGADVNTRDQAGRTSLLIAMQGSASEYRVIGANEPIARLLVDRGASINIQDNEGWSPLLKLLDQWADQPALVKFLIDHGANVNAQLKDGRTPLMVAARLGRQDRVSLLLDKGALVNARDAQGITALMVAITCMWDKDNQVVTLLLNHGANLDAVDSQGRSAVDYAARIGHLERVILLLSKGAKVKDRDQVLHLTRNVALFDAGVNGDLERTQAMLAQGADPDYLGPEGESSLMAAIQNDRSPKLVALLLDQKAKVNIAGRDGSTALMLAADRFNAEIVKLLLDHGADVKARDKDGNTALLRAANSRRSWDEKQEALIPALLEKGAEVNVQNTRGVTPLMLTAREGNSALLDLLKRGAEVDARDREGNTALLYASLYFVRWEQRRAGEALLDAGANANAVNQDGETPLLRAARQFEVEGVQLLLDHKADINVQDRNGQTPLMRAIDGPKDFDNTNHIVYSPKVAAFLVERKADMNARDLQGNTALKLARKQGYAEMVELLAKHGAPE